MQSRVAWLILAAIFFLKIHAQAETNQPVNFEPNVPLIFVQTPAPLQIGQKLRGTVRVQYPKNSSASDLSLTNVEIKYRGAVSLGYEKKSIAFELDSRVAIAGLMPRTHWILNAAYIDRSLMRNKLAYDLYSALSTAGQRRHAAASRFVEVIFNNQYQGAYLLTERVDRRLLELRRYNESDPAHACIYKSVEHAGGFDQDSHNGFEQHEPDPDTRPYWEPLDELNRFVNNASDEAFLDSKTGIASRVDIAGAIDFHLHLLMVCNTDSATKNYIIARNGSPNSSTPLFFFVPWDCDATFGRSWHGSREGYQDWLSHKLFDRLLRDPAYRRRFAERWKQLRQNQFSVPALQKMIDDNVQTLGPAARRNAARWPTDETNFEKDISQMKKWVADRTTWLDSEIEERTPQR